MNKEKIEICSEKILCIIMGLLFCLGLFIMGLRGRRIVLVGIVSVIINLQKLNRDKDYTKKVLGIKKIVIGIIDMIGCVFWRLLWLLLRMLSR